MTTAAGFAAKYGPWALILGASEGVGAAYAEAVAERGVNVALVARRQGVLDEVAAGIRERTGVETRSIAVDLATDDAMAGLAAATEGLEVGTVFYCAGADATFGHFLDHPVSEALWMVQRNCVVPLQVCHHFGAPMRERGRGAIVIVSSGASLVGAPNMVGYAATKAFDLVMTEALWSELSPRGVDVLALVLGLTDTPALRRLMVQRGAIPDFNAPIAGAVSTAEVVADALAHIADGPVCFVGERMKAGAQRIGSMSRNDAARMMAQVGAASITKS